MIAAAKAESKGKQKPNVDSGSLSGTVAPEPGGVAAVRSGVTNKGTI
jgi:hypothetical protein